MQGYTYFSYFLVIVGTRLNRQRVRHFFSSLIYSPVSNLSLKFSFIRECHDVKYHERLRKNIIFEIIIHFT